MLAAVLLVVGFAAPASEAAKPKSTLAYQYYTKGVELNARKKWEEALKQYQSAIDLNPSFVTCYIEFARASVMLGRRQQGLGKLEAAMAVARTKEDRERIQRERESLSEIFYTNDTFQQYQNGLNYLRLDRSGSSIEALDRARQTEPDNLLVLSAYARALRQEDRTKEAIPVLERALALNDGKREVRLELAEASLGSNPGRSHELLQATLAGGIDERGTILDAQALSALKRNREAIEAMRILFEKQPSSLYAPFWLGKLYEKESNGAWNARKYLMTFIRRAEPQVVGMKDDGSPELRLLKATRAEADQILARVNRSLE
jgi:tetratricopeptide (TPR) repeat protein